MLEFMESLKFRGILVYVGSNMTAYTRRWNQLMDEREPVTVLKLMEKTGLSRGFFYKNPTVRKELDRAFEQQAGMSNPKKKILDMAMNHEIQALLRQLREVQQDNEKLMKENETLKKALERKNRELICSL